MMIFDRQKQRLLLEGKEYTPGDIHSLVAEGEGNHPSAMGLVSFSKRMV